MIAVVPDKNDLRGLLGRKLVEDADGKVVAEYIECFEQALTQARQSMHGPISPKEYEMYAALAASASLSMDVVQAVWKALHP